MSFFAFGICSIVFAFVIPAFYWLNLGIRYVIAWILRAEFSRERKGVITIILVCAGFFLGSFVQPLYDKAKICHEDRKSVIFCVLFQK